MCGLSGIYHFDGRAVEIEVLRRMTLVQHHRGPDDQGHHLFSLRSRRSEALSPDTAPSLLEERGFEGGLGFNRLSILDLSAHGHQPMCTPDGSVCITLNGEIYNAFDFRPELESRGHHFRSTSDTEVALYLYTEYGLDGMLQRLNGMFAIGLVDLHSGEMFLIRDRLGIKPLYYYHTNGILLFASEIKAIMQHPAFLAELDEERIDEYLTFRYCAGDGTLLKGVHQLQPGHRMRVHPDGMRIERYWDIPERRSGGSRPLREQIDGLEACLQRSVKRQLLSDVKVGCQLSGGIDSSLVSLMASKQGREGMDYFSVVFEDQRISEEPWVDAAAAKAGGKSYKFRFEPDYFFDTLSKATWHLDQPLNHPNSLGISLLAERARSHVTVFLSGEGADEVFGGYTRFLYARLRPWLTPWSGLLAALPVVGSRLRRRYHQGRDQDGPTWFVQQSAFLRPEHLQRLRPGGGHEGALSRRRQLFDGAGGFVSNCLRYEMRTYLVDLLIRQDKMTMAHSMENRVPFLDHEVIDYVAGLPIGSLVQGVPTPHLRTGNTKRILKRLAERYFPKDFVYRAKSGFPLPLKSYFTDPRFRPVMEELVLPGLRRRGLIDVALVESWWRGIETKGSDAQEALWIVTAFELWARQFLDTVHPQAPLAA